MNIIERIKNIIITPKTEWFNINQEEETLQQVFTKYVLILALIPAVASAIGYSNYNVNVMGMEIKVGGSWISLFLKSYLGSIVSFFVCTYIVDALATNFNSEKNLNKSAQLVAYSFTASWISGVFNLIPSLSVLGILGLYSIYLFYIGLPIMKKTPEDKVIFYMLISALVIIIVNIAISFVMGKFLNF